ncbi:MAG: hlyB7 1, partial [Pseudomonas sp.]|nr:hlyB7 1 [Pseudomonas sp.]
MSLRNMNIAPRAFLGFAFIALLVIVLGFFALNRMSVIRQATTDMETDMLPSIGFLGDVNESILRLRLLAFRVMVNREPEQQPEANQRFVEWTDKLQQAKKKYAALSAGTEERNLYNEFSGTLERYLSEQNQLLELSRQNKVDDIRNLINNAMKLDS